MSDEHLPEDPRYVAWGDVACLRPIEELPADVHRGRRARLRLSAVPDERVLVATPTSFGSAMARSGVLRVVELDSLPAALHARLDAAVEPDVDGFELLRLGRDTGAYTDRTLAEFS